MNTSRTNRSEKSGSFIGLDHGVDGVLLQLHNGESEPLRQGPHMVCKACGHRWGSLVPPARCLTNTERPYRPAKVVRVHRAVGDGIMRLPVFGETRRPTALAAVAIAIGAVVALDKGGMQRRADG